MKAYVSKSPYPRTRIEGAINRSDAPQTVYRNFGSTQGTYVNVYYARMSGYSGTRRQCNDVVTPGYARRMAAGEVINNPFTSITCTCACGGSGPVVTYTGNTSPWPAGTTQVATHSRVQLHQNSEYLLAPPVDSEGNMYLPQSIVDVNHLLARAKTGALAKVDQSTAQALVGIAELRQTLLSLIQPLNGIGAFLNRFQFHPGGRYNFRTKKLNKTSIAKGSGLIPSVANQYLSFYYGLMPLMRDIESYIEAYIKEGLERERVTARSGLFDEKVDIRNVYGSLTAQNSSQFDHRYTRTDSVHARTGTIYEPSANNYQKLLGLRAADFFGSVYQAMPWSFFIDYFSNLGRLIEALTPRTGVTYLASWETLVYRMEWRAETTRSFINGSFVHSTQGTEWATRVIEARVRSPCSPYSHVRPVAFTGVWEDKAKVMAVLSLATQQLSKVMPILNF